MSTHGRSGVGRWLLGSVTDRVLCATGMPLLIYRSKPSRVPSEEMDFQRVVVPLDGSSLAEESLPHLVALSKGHRFSTNLLMVSSHGEEEHGRAYLSKVADRLKQQGLNEIEESVLDGHPVETIIDVARKTPHNLVLMTTHGRSGVSRWMLGSVTDRVVRYSGGPVLVIPLSN